MNPMRIDLDKLQYTFLAKPLLIGGKAMEYNGLRPAGADIDFVIAAEDYVALAQKYPDHTKDVFGDLGVCVYEFELWKRQAIRYDVFPLVGDSRLGLRRKGDLATSTCLSRARVPASMCDRGAARSPFAILDPLGRHHA